MQHLMYFNGLCLYAYRKISHTVTPGEEGLIHIHVVQYSDNMASVSCTDVELSNTSLSLAWQGSRL